jgi:hypothetical protein
MQALSAVFQPPSPTKAKTPNKKSPAAQSAAAAVPPSPTKAKTPNKKIPAAQSAAAAVNRRSVSNISNISGEGAAPQGSLKKPEPKNMKIKAGEKKVRRLARASA